MRMNRTKQNVRKIALYAGLILIALVQLFPLYWLFTFSLKDNMQIFTTNPLGLPNPYRFENFADVLQRGQVASFLLNSLLVTTATIAVSTVLSTMAAYAIARMKWKWSNTALLFFLMGMMIPLHATLVPLFIFLKRTNLYDTPFALILPYVAFAIPMAIYIFVGFFKTIPAEMEEAACLDGMSIYGIFVKIMVPLIRPAIATVAIFTYLSCWNELMFAISFISKPQWKTLTVGIMGMVGMYATNWGALGAGLVVATVPTLIIYLLMSGEIQKSFTTGAIKG
ncbi:MAG: carbohydrate ABC transporter permease [Clostridiales bacterium]|nr:carbohydrate ABC transporter permease [Clostridiales bacterium]